MRSALLTLLMLSIFHLPLNAQHVETTQEIEFKGEILEKKDISAVQVVGDLLVLGADEKATVQILRREGDDYRVLRNVALRDDEEEVDVEAIAAEGNLVYVMGSHSQRRIKLDEDQSDSGILKVGRVERQSSRERLYRFRLAEDGQVSEMTSTTLTPQLKNHEVLAPFLSLPSKENGVDIEGLAVRNGWLYIGMRGPVLRENLTPILKCRFADPLGEVEVLYVDLEGDGIRELVAANDGFLILSGPVSDRNGDFSLYHWDGTDCRVSEKDEARQENRQRLGEIPTPKNDKAEGMTLLSEDDESYELLVVYDEPKEGKPRRFRVMKR